MYYLKAPFVCPCSEKPACIAMSSDGLGAQARTGHPSCPLLGGPTKPSPCPTAGLQRPGEPGAGVQKGRGLVRRGRQAGPQLRDGPCHAHDQQASRTERSVPEGMEPAFGGWSLAHGVRRPRKVHLSLGSVWKPSSPHAPSVGSDGVTLLPWWLRW